MADEELLDPMADVGEGPEEAGAKGGGGIPLMRYIYLIVGVLIVQIVIVYMVFNWWFSASEGPSETPSKAVTKAEAPLSVSPPAGQPPVEVVYEKLDPIVVNPAGTEGLRFLSTSVHLGLASGAVEVFIDSKKLKSKIRDTLIGVFASKTIPQLDPAHHDELKAEIRQRLNAFLGENAVLEVYFQGFVLQ